MTITEEIEQIKTSLGQTAGMQEEAELLLGVLDRFAAINSPDSKPFIDRLLHLAEAMDSDRYRGWGHSHSAALKIHEGEYESAMRLARQALVPFIKLKDDHGLAEAHTNVGVIHENQGNYREAMKSHTLSLEISEKLKFKRGIAMSWNYIGNIFFLQGKYKEAMENYDRSLKLREEMGDKTGIAACYNNIGKVHFAQGSYPEAMENYFHALHIGEETGDRNTVAKSYNSIGIMYEQQGNYPEAMRNYMQALQIKMETGQKQGVASAYNNIGNVHYKQGNLPEAMRNYVLALQISEETGHKPGISSCYNNIANIHYKHDNDQEAMDNYMKALRISAETGNKIGISNSYGNIGNLYTRQGKYPEAVRNFIQSLQIKLEIDDKPGIAYCYRHIGMVHDLQGHYEDALQCHQQGLAITKSIGDKRGMATALKDIGEVYEKQGNMTEALRHKLLALEIGESIGEKKVTKEVSQSLSDSYMALGEYKNALKYHKKYHEMEKEMLGAESQKQIMNLNFHHNMELKEKEAQLLKEKSDAVAVYAQRLEVSNNELKQFAHVASHDLREPLRMVSSYMQLLEQTMGEEIKPVQKQFIGFALDGAKRMEQLIHDLLRLAKADADPKIETVSLSGVVAEVKSNLEVLLSEKKAKIISAKLPTIMADRTQVMQLFQNIISNGIKYNENAKPTIRIGYEPRETDALLTISDNGIGIPAEYRERAFQIFQRVPTAKQYQGTGIGLAICKKIVDGLGGTISIDDRKGGGTTFHITVPLSLVCEPSEQGL